MTLRPTVHESALEFDPSHPWVYHCKSCDEYIDVEDMKQHIEENKGDGHGVVTRIKRVDVIPA